MYKQHQYEIFCLFFFSSQLISASEKAVIISLKLETAWKDEYKDINSPAARALTDNVMTEVSLDLIIMMITCIR